jgi:hypothetical protein
MLRIGVGVEVGLQSTELEGAEDGSSARGELTESMETGVGEIQFWIQCCIIAEFSV